MSQACPWLSEHIKISINIQPYPRMLLVAFCCLVMTFFFHRSRSDAFALVVCYYSYTEIKLEKKIFLNFTT